MRKGHAVAVVANTANRHQGTMHRSNLEDITELRLMVENDGQMPDDYTRRNAFVAMLPPELNTYITMRMQLVFQSLKRSSTSFNALPAIGLLTNGNKCLRMMALSSLIGSANTLQACRPVCLSTVLYADAFSSCSRTKGPIKLHN